MALYYIENSELIEITSEGLSQPIRSEFLVSDEEITEVIYLKFTEDENTEYELTPSLVSTINNQYYYCLVQCQHVERFDII